MQFKGQVLVQVGVHTVYVSRKVKLPMEREGEKIFLESYGFDEKNKFKENHRRRRRKR